MMIPEYHTSKRCCHCHDIFYPETKKKKSPTKEKKEEPVETDATEEEKEEKKKRFTPLDASVYAVRACQRCRIVWNRDINAAWNMLSIFLYAQQHNGKIQPAFRPEEKLDEPSQKRKVNRKRLKPNASSAVGATLLTVPAN